MLGWNAVTDTGTGIEPDHLPLVFERYWNADPRGIGLGLYIARSIVRAHGGNISVRSVPGAGATFEFTLPRARAADVARPGRSSSSSTKRSTEPSATR